MKLDQTKSKLEKTLNKERIENFLKKRKEKRTDWETCLRKNVCNLSKEKKKKKKEKTYVMIISF